MQYLLIDGGVFIIENDIGVVKHISNDDCFIIYKCDPSLTFIKPALESILSTKVDRYQTGNLLKRLGNIKDVEIIAVYRTHRDLRIPSTTDEDSYRRSYGWQAIHVKDDKSSGIDLYNNYRFNEASYLDLDKRFTSYINMHLEKLNRDSLVYEHEQVSLPLHASRNNAQKVIQAQIDLGMMEGTLSFHEFAFKDNDTLMVPAGTHPEHYSPSEF